MKSKRKLITAEQREEMYSWYVENNAAHKMAAKHFKVSMGTISNILSMCKTGEAISKGFMGAAIPNTEMEYGFESFRELYIHQKVETVGNYKRV